ncbi:hypothetical protein [Streptomyces mirabilis]|uniref:hypothetical protein n=1 Tax=Streptomyces mirabilis TaxID=68239 RepID=UPI00331F0D78
MGSAAEPRSFLLIGSQRGDSVTAKLRTLRIPYKIKLLESNPENWKTILQILDSGNVKAVIARLSGLAFEHISSSTYQAVAPAILERIGKLPHIAFTHEDTLSGDFDANRLGAYLGIRGEIDDELKHLFLGQYMPPSAEVRESVGRMLSEHLINLIPYSTNAELSVLASNFIDDAEKNLLFRVYVPSGRLYATEAEKLLSLFHDWLQRGGRSGVRRDGYKTAAGQVFEFLGGENLQKGDLAAEFSDFSAFLELCVDNPAAAEESLGSLVSDRRARSQMVARYSREVRRLHLDLKHERESRLLSLRHEIETEVLDLETTGPANSTVLDGLVGSLVPAPGRITPENILAVDSASGYRSSVTVNLNPQFVTAVESTVLQNIQGTVNLGPEPQQLIELIRQYGGPEVSELESAVHELEDEDARTVDRLTARQRLKGFLGRMGSAIEGVAVSALQKYLESKLNL